MAMIICTECGREISEKASFCPGCGHPLKKEKASKKEQDRLKILLTAALLIAVAGYLPVGESKRKQKPLLYVIIDSLQRSGNKKKK